MAKSAKRTIDHAEIRPGPPDLVAIEGIDGALANTIAEQGSFNLHAVRWLATRIA